MATAPQGDDDPRGLHDLAVDAQTDLQKLATGLAHAGASPEAVSQLTKMSELLAQVVKALGEGPPLEAGQQGPPGQQPAGPPQPGPAQPAGPPPGGPPHAPTLHAATQALHQAMVSSAQQRQAPARP